MPQLDLAFSEIQKLPPTDQDEFAAWILEELHSEERWAKLFAEDSAMLSRLADEAQANNHEAMELHIETIIEDGEE